MNFDRNLLFAYLEEDNIQRAYFRVKPLLTVEGDIRAEAEKQWPNEGGLRIVPDRNEQHTFKVRMRTLGAYCVVDLTSAPADAGKIRTNKNFKPERGEVNQYILYSDTVHALPEHTFYEIVEGAADDFAAACEKAITPLFYIRQGDTLYGPVRKSEPAKPEAAGEAAGTLYELPCPDGVTRMILCMNDAPARPEPEEPAAQEESAAPAEQEVKQEAEETVEAAPVPEAAPAEVRQEEAPAEAPKAEDAALPIGETLNILDQSKGFEETLHSLDQQPLSKNANLLRQREPQQNVQPKPAAYEKPGELNGTPLIRTPLRTSTQQPKNRLQEVVANQWSVGKYEPPAQNLPAGTAMRAVNNPVEAACSSLRAAWTDTDAQNQLLDFILSLDGVRTKLEPKLCEGSHVSIMQKVLRDKLQDLEAERLTALCELDKARRDTDAYRSDVISQIKNRLAKETGDLEKSKSACETQVASLKTEVNALSAQRDALLDKVASLQSEAVPAAAAKLLADMQMAAPINGTPLRMTPVSGVKVDRDALIERLMAACAQSGVTIERNHAIALLVLLALCPRIGVSCATPAPASTLTKNIMAAMGWQSAFAHQFAPEQKPVAALRPVDTTPAVLMTSLPNYAPIAGISKLLLSRSAANLTRNVAYDMSQWPILLLPNLPFVAEQDAAIAEPVSVASLAAILEKTAANDEEITKVLSPVLKAAVPLSGAARKEMFRFVAVCAGLMEGGLPVAVDWAILLWIIPAIDRSSKNHNAIKALLDEYPLSLSRL
ncbi:MAG: hypothetical protein IJ438_10335 [Clostridia bacterium]|nr:hypothetical protein [Clostridia bacterium]